MRAIKIVAILAMVVMFGATVWGTGFGASTLRCGTALIKEGDSREKVLQACGEPDEWQGIRWVYYQGATEPYKVVNVFGGQVISINEDY